MVKKSQIVGSFNGISTTCTLEMGLFAQLRNDRCVSCLRNAIESKTAFSREFRCSLHVSVSFVEMKSNKDTRYKQTNCRPDYVLDRIDSWCRF